MLCNCASFFPIPFAVLLLSPRLPRESLSHVERISDRPWPGKRFRSRPEPDSCMEHITNTTICHIKTRALSFAKVRSPESDGSKTSSTLQLAPGGGGLVVGWVQKGRCDTSRLWRTWRKKYVHNGNEHTLTWKAVLVRQWPCLLICPDQLWSVEVDWSRKSWSLKSIRSLYTAVAVIPTGKLRIYIRYRTEYFTHCAI